MISIRGKYGEAVVYTDKLEDVAKDQIRDLCDEEISQGATIRVMPDVHSGKGCVIGLTMTITDKVIPNLVGVDIGCGISGIRLAEKELDFERVEAVISKNVPSGFAIRKEIHPSIGEEAKELVKRLRCQKHQEMNKAMLSLGTLGGGNHFIEIGRDLDGDLWLFIHSGSRGIGNQVAQHYQKMAIAHQKKLKKKSGAELEATIAQLKAEDRFDEIKSFLKNSKSEAAQDKPDLAYLEGQEMEDYLHDADLMQQYAFLNRKTMIQSILEGLKSPTKMEDLISVHHNYIDKKEGIIRKGAISAKENEIVFIPMNMRDGMIIGKGLGNPSWNCSAPHGAGRVMSRTAAKRSLSLEHFQSTMADVWSRSVATSTLDEAPMAYKPMAEILEHIDETVEVLEVVKPLYNFKAK